MKYRKLPIGQGAIADCVSEVALAIKADLAHETRELVIIPVLEGATIFYSDLARKLDHVRYRVCSIHVSSYNGAVRGSPHVCHQLAPADIQGNPVLIVDDIADSHHTLELVVNTIKELKPSHVKSAVLLRKPSRRDPHCQVVPDYVGFDIGDHYVIGYGMDYNGLYRNLPYIDAMRTDENGEVVFTGSELGPRYPDRHPKHLVVCK